MVPKIELRKYQKIFIGRHGNCLPADIDADRILSEKGVSDTESVHNQLKALEFNPESLIISHARRVGQTADILFPMMSRTVYGDLYNFEQFPNCEKLYANKVTNPRQYYTEDQEIVHAFQENLFKFLECDVRDTNSIAIISHAIISNFVAMMFTGDDTVYDTMLPESAGFLITSDSVELILP